MVEMLIGLVIGLAGGGVIVWAFYKLGFSNKQKGLDAASVKAQEDAQLLLANAEKVGESRKRELLLQAKEEIHKAKVDLERDMVKDKASWPGNGTGSTRRKRILTARPNNSTHSKRTSTGIRPCCRTS